MTDANDAGNSPRQANSPEGPKPRGQLALEMLPAVFVAGYLSFTIWLFFEGPIAWPITNGDSVFLFLAIAVTALFSGFTVGPPLLPEARRSSIGSLFSSAAPLPAVRYFSLRHMSTPARCHGRFSRL